MTEDARWRPAFTKRSYVAAALAMMALASQAAPAVATADDGGRDALVKRFVLEYGAYPLVADCAAQASFLIGAAHRYADLHFSPASFDSRHSSLSPWDRLLDAGGASFAVAARVTGSATAAGARGGSLELGFDCGYRIVEGLPQLIAFRWGELRDPSRSGYTGFDGPVEHDLSAGRAQAASSLKNPE